MTVTTSSTAGTATTSDRRLGDDLLIGGLGNDKCQVTRAPLLDGEAGDDKLYGNDGDDWIYGGTGTTTPLHGHDG